MINGQEINVRNSNKNYYKKEEVYMDCNQLESVEKILWATEYGHDVKLLQYLKSRRRY